MKIHQLFAGNLIHAFIFGGDEYRVVERLKTFVALTAILHFRNFLDYKWGILEAFMIAHDRMVKWEKRPQLVIFIYNQGCARFAEI